MRCSRATRELQALRQVGYISAPCVMVDLDDAHARLLAQAMNHIQGQDDLGLRAELLKEVLKALPQQEILSILPETCESLKAMACLGQETIAEYLQRWQQAQGARLKHLQFQLTQGQLEVVEEALKRFLPQARKAQGESPNVRGTGLYLLCRRFLAQEEKL